MLPRGYLKNHNGTFWKPENTMSENKMSIKEHEIINRFNFIRLSLDVLCSETYSCYELENEIEDDDNEVDAHKRECSMCQLLEVIFFLKFIMKKSITHPIGRIQAFLYALGMFEKEVDNEPHKYLRRIENFARSTIDMYKDNDIVV